MKPNRKIKLSVIFTVGFTVILILLAVVFFVESTESIKILGDSSIKINSKSLCKSADIFMQDAIERSAGEFSGYFNGVGNLTLLLASQLQTDFNKKNEVDTNSMVSLKMNYIKKLNLYFSPERNDIAAYYWGKNQNEVMVMERYFNITRSFFPFIQQVIKSNLGYFFNVWIIFNDYALTYPWDDFFTKAKDSVQVRQYFLIKNQIQKIKPENIDKSKPIWVNPYVDVAGKFCLSVYTPIYDKSGNFIAGAGIDLNLKKILEIVLYRKLLGNTMDEQLNDSSTFMFVIDSTGNIIVFPEEGVNLFSISKEYNKYYSPYRAQGGNLLRSDNSQVRGLAKDMCANSKGIKLLNLNGDKYIAAFSRLAFPKWSICLVVPEKKLLSFVGKTENKIEATQNNMIFHLLLISVLFLVIAIVLTLIFFRFYFIRPMKIISREIKKIGKGDFELQFSETGVGELDDLCDSFEGLGKELIAYTENLKREVENRQKIETELKYAAEMQKKILPRLDERFMSEKFELLAKLYAAKLVAGDFYDYFYIGEDKLALVVADVSGKGLNSAFFMAMSKILIKSTAIKNPEHPSEVLKIVNRLLSMDNKAMMFVTVFMIYYDIKTGTVTFANGGHHEAVHLSNSGYASRFGKLNNMALGIYEDLIFDESSFTLSNGDLIAVCTDGVLEAVSPENEEFGFEKFEQILKNNSNDTLDDIARSLLTEVKAFEVGDQFDDITLILIKKNN